MGLDSFGKLAVLEVIVYIPVALVAFFVTLRYGFARKAGWVLLLTFSLIRAVGAILTILSQDESNPSSSLVTIADILQALGLSPLLLATTAFVTLLSDRALPMLNRFMNIVRLVLVIGIILAVVGGIDQSPGHSDSDMSSGHNLSKIGSVLFLVGYVATFGVHVLLWGVRNELPPAYRRFLLSISLALPFIAVRVAYSLLSSFNSPMSEFSAVSGKWQIFLFMALLEEFIVVIIYIVSGLTIPLKDEINNYDQTLTSEPLQEFPWKPQQYYVRR